MIPRITFEPRRLASVLVDAERSNLRAFARGWLCGDCLTAQLVEHALTHERPSVYALARTIGINPRTLSCRAWRKGVDLAALIDRVRIVLTASVVADSAVSLSIAAQAAGYSSPQHFFRHVTSLRGVNASAWRATRPFPVEFAALRDSLLRDHAAIDGLVPARREQRRGGNARQLSFMNATHSWEHRVNAVSADGYFKVAIRRHPSTASWSWALEWNENVRLIGAFGDPSSIHQFASALDEPVRNVVHRDARSIVTIRADVPLSEDSDVLFGGLGPSERLA